MRMTSRRAGVAAIVVGIALAVWSWSGIWPWGGPAIYSGSDYAAINSVGLGVVVLGCLTALAGVLLVFAGRGGPQSWDG
jgi:hypothetical protein